MATKEENQEQALAQTIVAASSNAGTDTGAGAGQALPTTTSSNTENNNSNRTTTAVTTTAAASRPRRGSRLNPETASALASINANAYGYAPRLPPRRQIRPALAEFPAPPGGNIALQEHLIRQQLIAGISPENIIPLPQHRAQYRGQNQHQAQTRAEIPAPAQVPPLTQTQTYEQPQGQGLRQVQGQHQRPQQDTGSHVQNAFFRPHAPARVETQHWRPGRFPHGPRRVSDVLGMPVPSKGPQGSSKVLHISNNGITIPHIPPATFIPRTRYPEVKNDNQGQSENGQAQANHANADATPRYGQYLTVPGDGPPPRQLALEQRENPFPALLAAHPPAYLPPGLATTDGRSHYAGAHPFDYNRYHGGHPVSNERGAPETDYELPRYEQQDFIPVAQPGPNEYYPGPPPDFPEHYGQNFHPNGQRFPVSMERFPWVPVEETDAIVCTPEEPTHATPNPAQTTPDLTHASFPDLSEVSLPDLTQVPPQDYLELPSQVVSENATLVPPQEVSQAPHQDFLQIPHEEVLQNGFQDSTQGPHPPYGPYAPGDPTVGAALVRTGEDVNEIQMLRWNSPRHAASIAPEILPLLAADNTGLPMKQEPVSIAENGKKLQDAINVALDRIHSQGTIGHPSESLEGVQRNRSQDTIDYPLEPLQAVNSNHSQSTIDMPLEPLNPADSGHLQKTTGMPIQPFESDAHTHPQRTDSTLLQPLEPVQSSRSQPAISMPLKPIEPDPSQATTPTNLNILHALLAHPELFVLITEHLCPHALISLWRTSRTLRTSMIQHLPRIIKLQTTHRYHLTSTLFPWRCYSKLWFRRFADQTDIHVDRYRSLGKSFPITPDSKIIAYTASLRWLQMLQHRTDTINSILVVLKSSNMGFPARFKASILKIWFLMDIPDSTRRMWTIQNPNLWTDLDIFMASFFVVRIDMFTKHYCGTTGSGTNRKLIFAQPSLTFCLHVLARHIPTNETSYKAALTRWRYLPSPVDFAIGVPLFGVPLDQAGSLQFEGYGQANKNGNIAARLIRPDELVLRELVRRGLDVNVMYQRIFMYAAAAEFRGCERPGAMWDREVRRMVVGDGNNVNGANHGEGEDVGEGEDEGEGGGNANHVNLHGLFVVDVWKGEAGGLS
ncbi:hypothetical protein BJY04DRAFT_213772 [Aspergillus karnatakaensis]|uniref:uncharacterized protein n=1 Tax=Aspergillus karnatakaensis TaxID=1810916 RepID=UPI003CCD4E96